MSAPQREKLWSALVFGSNVLDELSEPEMMTLAMKGGAVSPVTSYLAIEPGVRPSTEGLDWGTGQGFGSGHGRFRRIVGDEVTRVFVRSIAKRFCATRLPRTCVVAAGVLEARA